jgi:hypothetical protein
MEDQNENKSEDEEDSSKTPLCGNLLFFLILYSFTIENPLPTEYLQNPIRDLIPVDSATQPNTRSRSPSPVGLPITSPGDQEKEKQAHSDSEEHLDDRRSNVTSVPPKKRDIPVTKETSQEPSQESQVIFL